MRGRPLYRNLIDLTTIGLQISVMYKFPDSFAHGLFIHEIYGKRDTCACAVQFHLFVEISFSRRDMLFTKILQQKMWRPVKIPANTPDLFKNNSLF